MLGAVQQRGTAIKSLLASVERLHGPEALKNVLAALPDGMRAKLDGPILAVGWYDTSLVGAIHLAVRDHVGRGDWSVSKAIGREAAGIDFGGVYRLLLRAVQYDSIWDRITRAWAQYNSAGKAEWIARSPGSATGLISGVEGFNHGQWWSIAGRCEKMLEMAGAKGTSVDPIEMTATSAKIEAIWIE
jgi:hypothetical protein